MFRVLFAPYTYLYEYQVFAGHLRWGHKKTVVSVPVQNREKEKGAASSPSYDVSSHVPSWKANMTQTRA